MDFFSTCIPLVSSSRMGECSAKLNRKWLLSLLAAVDFLKTFLDVPVVDEDLNSDSLEVPDDPKKKSSLAFFNWFALGDNNDEEDSVDARCCSKLE